MSIVPQTGQIISYVDGDDGDLQSGLPWPIPRFTDNGDGTVTDNLTRLEWTKNANLSEITDWSQAVSVCNNCDVGENKDWHLPNVRELHSLVDYSKYYPVLPNGHPFDNMTSDECWYWSSTTEADCNECAWLVNLGSGNMDGEYKDVNAHVWCVRGGQLE